MDVFNHTQVHLQPVYVCACAIYHICMCDIEKPRGFHDFSPNSVLSFLFPSNCHQKTQHDKNKNKLSMWVRGKEPLCNKDATQVFSQLLIHADATEA